MEHVIWLEEAGLVAGAASVQTHLVVGDHSPCEDLVDGLVLGEVDNLSLPRALGMDIPGERRPEAESGGYVVGSPGDGTDWEARGRQSP